MCLKLLLLVAFTGALSLLQAASTILKGTPLEGIEIQDSKSYALVFKDTLVYECAVRAVEASPTFYKGSSDIHRENVQQLLTSCMNDPMATPPIPTPPSGEPTEPKMDDPLAGNPLEGIEIDHFVALALKISPAGKSCVIKAVKQDPEAYKGSSPLNKANFEDLVDFCVENPSSQPPLPRHP